jgi:glycerophosphoryl diester phosphodiesterase
MEHVRLFDRGGRERPWVIAHRGDSSRAPENTLAAALAAVRGGADAWELDVQLTRDGVPVVIHDDSLTRTTDVAARFATDRRRDRGYLVSDFDLREIRTLDAGSWFVAPTGGPRSALGFGTLAELTDSARAEFASGAVRVPTLEEVLRWTVERDWLANVELKSVPLRPAGLLDAVLRLIAETGAAGHVWLSSFDHAEAAEAAHRGAVPAAVLSAAPLYRPARYVREWVGAAAYHPSVEAIGARSRAFRDRPEPESLRTTELSELREADVPVLVYTVNAIEPGGLADILATAGVRGVFTDRPSELASRWSGLRFGR